MMSARPLSKFRGRLWVSSFLYSQKGGFYVSLCQKGRFVEDIIRFVSKIN